MFNSSILQIQEELHYHQQQQEKLEQELYTLKSYEEFAGQAFDNVKDTIEQIQDPKYLELFRESLLSLFPIFPNEPIYLEESVETNDYVEKINSYPIPATSGEAEAATLRVGDANLRLDEAAKQVEEKKKKSYFELTGKPDLRPTTYEDLSVNISYSSSGRAYIGFNDRQEAESFRERLTVPSMLDEAQIMYMYKWEVKFYCDREYLQQFVEVQKESKSQFVPSSWEYPVRRNIEEITHNIMYDSSDKTAYIGMKAKGRGSSYGDYLTRVLTIGSKYLITNKSTVVQNAKYEFRIFDISSRDIKQLAKFNLNKDYDDKENKEVREVWETTKLRPAPQAYKPAPKLIPLEEIELGEIVYLNSVTNQYKVLNKVELDDKLHLEVVCVYNKQMKTLVGQISYLKECYRVPLNDVYTPHLPSLPSLKSNELTTEDFTAPPYQKISLNEIEVCDIVSTGEYVKAYYEITEHRGSHLIGKCIHHDSLKMRIGQECNLVDPYLVEKAILPTSVEAHFTRSHLLSSSEDGAVRTETSKIMAVA